MRMVEDLGGRILVLDYGKPLAPGTSGEVLNDPRAIARVSGAGGGVGFGGVPD